MANKLIRDLKPGDRIMVEGGVRQRATVLGVRKTQTQIRRKGAKYNEADAEALMVDYRVAEGMNKGLEHYDFAHPDDRVLTD